ncbi:hypothetical protein FSP39_015747 [Pinctada imbricata]|uniref:Heat shock 70 kDa protein 12A n=1 Tax=Pinctada imbricata TaxID=66713 RepID=A0AA88Y945_PINIB|nr:hypothetical protein FSP39_015747 [Pinctada imbricata]
MSGEPLLVAAIDFGTTFSGYAFSFKHDYVRDPLKINASNWIAGTQTLISPKAPTTVLLDTKKQFHAFGYEAENKYSELVDEGKHKGWLYFSRFKMKLHNNPRLCRSMMIKDENDYEMPALTIFTMAIKYLKEHLLKIIKDRVDVLDANKDIRWVLTVPAIWEEGAKQFMREAAELAGIPGKQLLLALEPEAASIYCNKVPVEMKSSLKDKNASVGLRTGTQYMVLDLGGGTADITVHEVLKDGSLREIHKATGGAWGGTKVDGTFYQFLVKLFGNDVLQTLKKKHLDDYLGLIRDFELKKRTIKPSLDTDSKITVRIPFHLNRIFKEQTGESLADALPNTNFASSVTFQGDKMRVQSQIFKDFFSDAVQGITGHVIDVLSSCPNFNITRVLLVGGFSESEMVLNALKEVLPDKRIIAPADPGLAVLKGAVLYGHATKAISSRVSQFTYGFEVFNPFIEGVHPECYKVIRPDGRVMCSNMFEKYVVAGQEVPVGYILERSFTPSDEDSEKGIGVYRSRSSNPTFITDRSCVELGKIVIKRPNDGWQEDAQLHVSMEFGGTEFLVKIRDDNLDNTYTQAFSFLK